MALQQDEPWAGWTAPWTSSGTSGEPGIFLQDSAALSVYSTLLESRMDRRFATHRWWALVATGAMGPWGLRPRSALVSALDGHYAGVSFWTRHWRCGRAARDWPRAPERRLGADGAGRCAGPARPRRHRVTRGAADQSGEPRAAADPLPPRRQRGDAPGRLRLRQPPAVLHRRRSTRAAASCGRSSAHSDGTGAVSGQSFISSRTAHAVLPGLLVVATCRVVAVVKVLPFTLSSGSRLLTDARSCTSGVKVHSA